MSSVRQLIFLLPTCARPAEAMSYEELLTQFRKVEKLSADKKKVVKELLDAFIFKNDLQKQLSS